MRKSRLFDRYASYHSDSRNRVFHACGFPLIILGFMGLSAQVRLGPVDLAIVVGVLAVAWYACLDVRGAVVSLLLFAVLYVIGTKLPWEANAGAFVLGCLALVGGHRIEGTKPGFFESLIYLSVGPLYTLEEGVDALARCF